MRAGRIIRPIITLRLYNEPSMDHLVQKAQVKNRRIEASRNVTRGKRLPPENSWIDRGPQIDDFVADGRLTIITGSDLVSAIEAVAGGAASSRDYVTLTSGEERRIYLAEQRGWRGKPVDDIVGISPRRVNRELGDYRAQESRRGQEIRRVDIRY